MEVDEDAGRIPLPPKCQKFHYVQSQCLEDRGSRRVAIIQENQIQSKIEYEFSKRGRLFGSSTRTRRDELCLLEANDERVWQYVLIGYTPPTRTDENGVESSKLVRE
ncbi:hypothetical protein WN944_003475 [Citrus x changshan-huyou]|uniref:Uncharacterized protein n=1 Tax=Citrus x changshan-huyou TaxID=2935761 RepID=A0AAP0LYK7_9ROSI